MKIKVNDNFRNLISYIRNQPHEISIYEMIQYSEDYDLYIEFYQNYHILKDLIIEHNQEIRSVKWKPVD